MQKSYAILIPTLNRPVFLKRCLQSVAAQSIKPTECIIIDQSDNEETKKIFNEASLPGIEKKYIFQKKKSLIDARNNGLDHLGDVKYASFIDDEIVLEPDYYEHLLNVLEKNPEIAGTMGTMHGTLFQNKKLAQIFCMSRQGDGFFLMNGMPTFPHYRTVAGPTEFLSGGMSLFRAEVLKKFRYDPRLAATKYGYGDDTDLSYRISRKHKLWFEPKAKMHDDFGPGKDPGLVHRKNWMQNMYYLLEKNVGKNTSNTAAFYWMMLGSMVDDLIHQRKGAFVGNFLALKNILMGNIDSVENYREFKKSLKKRT